MKRVDMSKTESEAAFKKWWLEASAASAECSDSFILGCSHREAVAAIDLSEDAAEKAWGEAWKQRGEYGAAELAHKDKLLEAYRELDVANTEAAQLQIQIGRGSAFVSKAYQLCGRLLGVREKIKKLEADNE